MAVNKPAAVRKAKKAIAKGFRRQLDGAGFSLVEILAPCPTNWKLGTIESCSWIDNVMAKQFPLGVVKEVPYATGDGQAAGAPSPEEDEA